MKRKIRLKTKKINLKNKIIITILLIIILICYILNYVNNKISPKLIEYAELELKKISSIIINKAVSKHAVTTMNLEDLFIITRNDQNEILTIDFNTVILNKVLTQTTSGVQLNLKKLEKGIIDYDLINESSEIDETVQQNNGVIIEIPIGLITNNFLLSNLGPKIPVRLKLIGDIETGINTKITNYGINNALIEVYLDIKINEKIILPISSKSIEVTTSTPISLKIIKGTVPKYYAGTLNEQSPSISVPLE